MNNDSILKRVYSKKYSFSYCRAFLSVLHQETHEKERIEKSIVSIALVETKVERLIHLLCLVGVSLHSARHFANDEYKDFSEVSNRIIEVLNELKDSWDIDEIKSYSSLINEPLKLLATKRIPLAIYSVNDWYNKVDSAALLNDINAVLSCSLSKRSDMDTMLNLIGFEDNPLLNKRVINYPNLPMN